MIKLTESYRMSGQARKCCYDLEYKVAVDLHGWFVEVSYNGWQGHYQHIRTKAHSRHNSYQEAYMSLDGIGINNKSKVDTNKKLDLTFAALSAYGADLSEELLSVLLPYTERELERLIKAAKKGVRGARLVWRECAPQKMPVQTKGKGVYANREHQESMSAWAAHARDAVKCMVVDADGVVAAEFVLRKPC
jgi:hypothetical protein